MGKKMIYYRPEWTCGRYNKDKHAALLYNLIEGMVYFFEDVSADVIGNILSVGRNGAFTIDSIAYNNQLSIESLIDFMGVLSDKNLVISNIPSEEDIRSYSKEVSKWKRHKLDTMYHSTQDKLPIKTDDAEVLYLRKVGGITQAMLELTYSCSEKCIHCYNIGATRNDEERNHRSDRLELTLDEYKKIIDQLYESGCFRISLSGGDPFSNLHVWEIIEYIYNKGIAIDIYTNAQNLVGKVEKLIRYYPRLMSISLYADNPVDHDFITRIPGSWNKTISVMEQLGEYAVPMDVKVCIMRTNIKSYRGVTQITRKVGGIALYEACLNDSIDGDKCVSTFLRLIPEEYDIILRDPNIGLYVGKEAPDYGKQYHDPNMPMCEGGREAICISPEGNVMPCTSLELFI